MGSGWHSRVDALFPFNFGLNFFWHAHLCNENGLAVTPAYSTSFDMRINGEGGREKNFEVDITKR